MKLHIDIETYCELDLTKVGLYKYAKHHSFKILMVAYAIENQPVKILDLQNGENLNFLKTLLENPNAEKWAHNANFERVCFDAIGIKVQNIKCTQFLCNYAGITSSLESASTFLNLGEKAKDKKGKELIKKFSMPYTGKIEENDWQDFKNYCMQDVEAERAIHDKLQSFYPPENEFRLFNLDSRINDRGFTIDTEFIHKLHTLNIRQNAENAVTMSNDFGVQKAKSAKEVREYLLNTHGLELESVAAGVLKSIKTDDEKLQKFLELKAASSKSSTAKIETFLDMGLDSKLYGQFQFYGAERTGRWAGRGVQPHNLPREEFKVTEQTKEDFIGLGFDKLKEKYGNLSNVLPSLIRCCIVAQKGKTLGIFDFSAIEARVLAWLAGETWKLEVFKTTGKIYEEVASRMFNTPIELITKDSPLRFQGKTAELGLGYGGGKDALSKIDRNGQIPDELKQGLVNKWRLSNPQICKFWKGVNDRVIRCITTKNTVTYNDAKLKFHYVEGALGIELPSGRCLYYQDIRITPNLSISYYEKNFRKDTWYGKFVENICQAVARDLLAFALVNLEANGYKIVLHVHDEIVLEGNFTDIKVIENIMSTPPSWANGLPLGVEGFTSNFYKK